MWRGGLGMAGDGIGSGLGEVETKLLGRVISDDTLGALCVFAEARGEPYEGQVAVGNVIRNRTRLKFFSQGTVVSTVFQPYQFSWTNTPDAQRAPAIAERLPAARFGMEGAVRARP